MAEEQFVQDAFTRMADDMECPHCKQTGFDLAWVKPERPSFPLSGTTLGHDKIPHLTCRGCGLEVDGNTPA